MSHSLSVPLGLSTIDCTDGDSTATARPRINGRYQRYKANTDKLITWLVETANRQCDVTRLVRSLRGQRDWGQYAKDTIFEVRAAELVPLAQAIIAARPLVGIPAGIMTTAKDVIVGRQSSADKYARRSMKRFSALLDEDIAHQHFIGVLQQVHDVLSTSHQHRTDQHAVDQYRDTSPTSTKRISSSPEPERNTFDHSTSRDSATINNETTATSYIHNHAPLDLSKASFKLEKQKDDRLFALCCHLHDLGDARAMIRDAWVQYMDGNFSFLAASITTDAGFGLMRCLDDEFAVLNQELATYEDILNFLHLDVVWYPGDKCVLIVNEGYNKENLTFDAGQNVTELLCGPGALTVRYHAAQMRHFQPKDRKGSQKENISHDCLAQWSRSHPLAETIYSNCFFLFGKLQTQDRFDDFISAFVDVASSGQRRTWHVVATQTYMDVFDIPGMKKSMGMDTLKQAASMCQTTHEQIHEYFKSHLAEILGAKHAIQWFLGASRSTHKAMKVSESDHSALRSGKMHSAKFKAQMQVMRENVNNWTRGLEDQLPTCAGSSAISIKLLMLEEGVRSCNDNIMVHAMAFLYKAARHVGYANLNWPDMEFLIQSQPSGSSFAPGSTRTTTLSGLLRSFETSAGIYIAAHTGTPAAPDPLRNGRPVRVGADFTSRLLAALHGDGKSFVSLPTTKLVQILLHQVTSAEEATQEAKGKGQASQSKTYSVSELLATFMSSFKQDEPNLNFNYAGFWIDCSQLLHDIVGALKSHKSMKPSDVARYVESSDGPRRFAHFTLGEAAAAQDDRELLSLSLLAAVGPLIDAHIERDGNSFVKAAYGQSSGHLPKQACPHNEVDYPSWRAERLKEAMTMASEETHVAISGGLAVLYHPRLTLDDLEKARADEKEERESMLPGYMLR
ncbi:hypothetical protein CLAFUW4_12296 [Fulvia fulva]|uniref:DUF6604 domain-containing protein n=1 Tax=Passalora fulva TaxID=5499 RepID=A0A9Q8PEJ4_PASFU|nr:uncharacterized protein CLAFUR5_11326 [Fulvia fulva]KAK4618927.1 hypothetical protein CLAFUR0_12312 [Fulvia fulva]UJO21051.1 hypothetical protein CLAFUR5_11326 [Fulvia fulva]WPV17958.1 hypothetical protein CLAFUW4_12296 [Fulvia fulva]